MVRSIQGLEKAEIMRFAYAVEYDFAPATQLYPTLETKRVRNLFFAGQLNGTTGYEEAAAQGLMAGINASLKAKNQSQLVLDRASAYIGVLIDDLVTKDIREPYRMFTSRAEHRLQLREDNADWRLTEIGYQIGTVCESDYNKFVKKKKAVLTELRLLSQTQIKPTEEMAKKLEKVGLPTIKTAMTLADLLKRPHITYQQISDLATEIRVSSTINLDQDVSCAIREQVEIQIKYAGYIARQDLQIEKFRRLETLPIPSNFNFDAVHGLKTEARKKLSQVRPVSIGHASRVPGVTPADISILMVWLKSREMKEINNEKKEDKNLLA